MSLKKTIETIKQRLPGRKIFCYAFIVFVCLLSVVAIKTRLDLLPVPDSLSPELGEVRKARMLDRNRVPLTVTYGNRWNIHDTSEFHEFPRLLRDAFLHAEDKRFFSHSGLDWTARMHALYQNIAAMKAVRGASTITEQVVRMLHPRPRTVWSRWLEGFEAVRLEQRFSKDAIFEFYLNQVPYAANRRGAVQAAWYYFDRDLNTLSQAEMLTLAVLVRAPGRMDLFKGTQLARTRAKNLATTMLDKGVITNETFRAATTEAPVLARNKGLKLQAAHFVNHIYNSSSERLWRTSRLVTTLDGALQSSAQKILDNRLTDLASRDVSAGAVLIIDHTNGEVLAWVNSRTTTDAKSDNRSATGVVTDAVPGSHIDAITTPRQPGSTLKPFLYALALEKGWTPATIISDSPLKRPVGTGLHEYHNYSRSNYGPVRLRDALGNSLNIPAVRTVQFVGTEGFLNRLKKIGFTSLDRSPEYYGEGLALGNGEVTLRELVAAYSVLARGGEFLPISLLMDSQVMDFRLVKHGNSPANKKIFTPESTSLIADILSDPEARRLEFGSGNLLRFPAQSAVKTGTSTDYRDAWAVGFSHKHTVGVWMGNLDQRPMKDVTGSTGPALVLRAVFAELNRSSEPAPLYLSASLTDEKICRVSGALATPGCPSVMSEWFEPEKTPTHACALHGEVKLAAKTPPQSLGPNRRDTHTTSDVIQITQPTPGLLLAMDPRIPDLLETFEFKINKDTAAGCGELIPPCGIEKIKWLLDGKVVGTSKNGDDFLWHLSRGSHTTKALVWRRGQKSPVETASVRFLVK